MFIVILIRVGAQIGNIGNDRMQRDMVNDTNEIISQ